ncbi:MAG: hypothetical protein IT426_21135 [Pirellulales bacterium]|nr:hypothetical protein [Pirellulales bacterium]
MPQTQGYVTPATIFLMHFPESGFSAWEKFNQSVQFAICPKEFKHVIHRGTKDDPFRHPGKPEVGFRVFRIDLAVFSSYL